VRARVLPARRSRLIGRDLDLAAVQDLVLHGDNRLVTLTGVGGVGKTTLALEAGRLLGPSMPDRAWVVDLATIVEAHDPAPVVLACCAALGLPDQARQPTDVLIEHLEPRQALLVLDNCEHVHSAVGQLVDALLDACPYLRVVATSRVPLRIRGESVFPVSPMALPEPGGPTALSAMVVVPSVELFVRRARAADPGFELSEASAPAVGGICRRLAGIPLAIELAAAHIGALAPAEIEERLGHVDGLLATTATGVPDRQQTMEAALEWSHRFLAPGERAVFRRFSMFVGGWTLAAAEAICGLDGEPTSVAAALSSLVEQSLVIRDPAGPGGRFRFLQPIAEFAGRRLDEAGERTQLGLPFAHHFLSVAGKRDPGATQASAEDLDRIATDYENCRAALRFAEEARIAPIAIGLAGALAGYWRVRGHLHAGAQHLTAALELAGPEASHGRELALVVLADYERLLGRYQGATRHAAEAISVAESLGDGIGQRTAIAILGDAAAAQGSYEEAHAHYARAWELIAAQPHPIAIGFWHANVGQLAMREGRLDDAHAHFEEALAALSETERTWYQGRVLASLGAVEQRLGQLDRAQRDLADGFDHLIRYGARVDAIGCIESLGRVALDLGDPARAATLFAAAGALRDATAVPPDDVDRAALAADIDRARDGQRRPAFVTAWALGRAMSFEEVARSAAAPTRSTKVERRAPRGSQLTRREREIAGLIAAGLTNPQIAERLFISAGTVRGHVEQILGKLGLTSRVQVATWIVGERAGDTAPPSRA
jgi:predicted ATPase/DNA-binding CsgD family transcriptional regulator